MSRHSLIYFHSLPRISGTQSGMKASGVRASGSNCIDTKLISFKVPSHPPDGQTRPLPLVSRRRLNRPILKIAQSFFVVLNLADIQPILVYRKTYHATTFNNQPADQVRHVIAVAAGNESTHLWIK